MKFIPLDENAFSGPEVHLEQEVELLTALRDSSTTEEEYYGWDSQISELVVELQWWEMQQWKVVREGLGS